MKPFCFYKSRNLGTVKKKLRNLWAVVLTLSCGAKGSTGQHCLLWLYAHQKVHASVFRVQAAVRSCNTTQVSTAKTPRIHYSLELKLIFSCYVIRYFLVKLIFDPHLGLWFRVWEAFTENKTATQTPNGAPIGVLDADFILSAPHLPAASGY